MYIHTESEFQPNECILVMSIDRGHVFDNNKNYVDDRIKCFSN